MDVTVVVSSGIPSSVASWLKKSLSSVYQGEVSVKEVDSADTDSLLLELGDAEESPTTVAVVLEDSLSSLVDEGGSSKVFTVSNLNGLAGKLNVEPYAPKKEDSQEGLQVQSQSQPQAQAGSTQFDPLGMFGQQTQSGQGFQGVQDVQDVQGVNVAQAGIQAGDAFMAAGLNPYNQFSQEALNNVHQFNQAGSSASQFNQSGASGYSPLPSIAQIELQSSYDSLRRSYTELKTQYETSQVMLQDKSRELSSLQLQLDSAMSTIKDLQAKISSLTGIQGQLAQAQAENASLSANLDKISKEYNAANTALSKAVARTSSLQVDLDTKNTDINNLKASLNSTQQELVVARQTITQMQHSMSASPVKDLKSQVYVLQKDISSKKEENCSLSTTISSLQSKISELEEELSVSDAAKIKELQSALDDRDSKLKDAATSLSKAKSIIESYKSKDVAPYKTIALPSNSNAYLFQADGDDFIGVDTGSWQGMSLFSEFDSPVPALQYTGITLPNAVVIASGNEGGNQIAAKYIRSKLYSAYQGELTGSDAYSLGTFDTSKNTLIVSLTYESYLDYYTAHLPRPHSKSKLHTYEEEKPLRIGVDLDGSDQGLSWLQGSISLQEAILPVSNNVGVVSVGTGYSSESWLRNINWDEKVVDLSRQSCNIIFDVGCLSSYVRKSLFKYLTQVTGRNAIISQGDPVSVRGSLANIVGLSTPQQGVTHKVSSSGLQYSWHIVKPTDHVKSSLPSLIDNNVNLVYEYPTQENAGIFKASEV